MIITNDELIDALKWGVARAPDCPIKICWNCEFWDCDEKTDEDFYKEYYCKNKDVNYYAIGLRENDDSVFQPLGTFGCRLWKFVNENQS